MVVKSVRTGRSGVVATVTETLGNSRDERIDDFLNSVGIGGVPDGTTGPDSPAAKQQIKDGAKC